MDTTVFDSLIAVLARRMDMEKIEKTDDDLCMLEFGDVVVCFRFLHAAGNILIFSDLGHMPETGREAFFRQLLEANHALFETAGATLSVYSPLDMVALQYLCQAETTDEQRFLTIVENFVVVARHWREKCAQFSAEQVPDAEDGNPGGQDFLLRV